MGVVEGRDAIRGFFEHVRAPYEDFEQVIEEFRDLGNGVGFRVTVLRGDIDQARAPAERLAEERWLGSSTA